MLKIKNQDVNVKDLKCVMYFACAVVECEFAYYNLDPVITSAVDSVHNPNSLHGQGFAIDFRWEVQADISDMLFHKIQDRLERHGFDVVDERKPQQGKVWTGPHVHIEFDPKPGETFWKYA